MERKVYSSPMALHLVEKNIFGNDPFCLVDVGASGGIDILWNVFGHSLKAFAFEPLIAECIRLNGDNKKHPGVTYYPYFMTAEDPVVQAESGHHEASKVFVRSSCVKAEEIEKLNYIQTYFNQGSPAVYTQEKISVDKFFAHHSVDTVDFIKIDTDGYDYEVLHGAQALLQDKQVLGVMIEAQFHGKNHPHSNLFRNIDRLLTEAGFALFDLDLNRYTKKELPGPFYYNVPAQTKTGQVLWGDALYLRDGAANNPNKLLLSPLKLLKLAALFEIFALPDCAAELLLSYKDKLSSFVDIQRCLDLLVKNIDPQKSYKEYIESFETNPKSFFPNFVAANSSTEQKSEEETTDAFSKFFKKLATLVE